MKPTFEDVINDKTASVVYAGTNVDEATQAILLNWFFDYPICIDDVDKWLRYWKRRLMVIYPRYLDLMRVLGVRENFDPYVTDYFEEVRGHKGEKKATGKDARTPDLVTETVRDSQDGSTTIRTPELENKTTYGATDDTTTTRTPNLTSEAVQSGGHIVTETPNDTTTTEAENKGYSNGFAISYPEANLTTIPVEADGVPDIKYASSQAYNPTKTVEHSEARHTGNIDTETTYNNEKTTTTDTGSEKTVAENKRGGIDTLTATGMETTVVNGTGSGTDKTTTKGDEITTHVASEDDTTTDDAIHKGRGESVADIIPRAIEAVTGTQEALWFVESMKVCFDLYAYI